MIAYSPEAGWNIAGVSCSTEELVSLRPQYKDQVLGLPKQLEVLEFRPEIDRCTVIVAGTKKVGGLSRDAAFQLVADAPALARDLAAYRAEQVVNQDPPAAATPPDPPKP